MHFLSPSRRSPDAVILEGRRLIADAINAGFYPSLFVFSRIKCLKDIPFDLSRSHEMYQIPFTNIAAWSKLKAPPGVMGKIVIKDLGSWGVYINPYIEVIFIIAILLHLLSLNFQRASVVRLLRRAWRVAQRRLRFPSLSSWTALRCPTTWAPSCAWLPASEPAKSSLSAGASIPGPRRLCEPPWVRTSGFPS